jgi:hypothetical protein
MLDWDGYIRPSNELAYEKVKELSDLYAKRAVRAFRSHSMTGSRDTLVQQEVWNKASKETMALANRLLREIPH